MHLVTPEFVSKIRAIAEHLGVTYPKEVVKLCFLHHVWEISGCERFGAEARRE